MQSSQGIATGTRSESCLIGRLQLDPLPVQRASKLEQELRKGEVDDQPGAVNETANERG